MTDKQLHVLLDTLRQELAKTIEESAHLLMAGRVFREDDPSGRFVALAPLDDLVRDWELRFSGLLPEKEETPS